MTLQIAVDNTDTIRHNQAVVLEIETQMNKGVNVPLHKAYNMLHKEGLTLPLRKKLAEMYGMNASELKNTFATLERNEQLIQELGSVPNDEYNFVDLLLAKWDITMTFQKMYTLRTPYEVSDIVLSENQLADHDKQMQVYVRSADPKTLSFKSMIEKVIKANSVMKINYNEAKIIRAVEDWTNTQQNLIVALSKSKITFESSLVTRAEVEWDRLVAAITDQNIAETKVVLKHFIWQVKRKMFNKEVDDHMMPVLSGLQGIGKSTLVKRITAPIKDFTVMTNFKDITDGRDHELWKNFVLILDEMGNSTQSNIEEIKQKITGDTFSPRVMKTNSNTLIVNSATMIGTTNKDLSTLIFDDSGMRRFYQIASLPMYDWTVINTLDYSLLWRSIDEDNESPLRADKALYARIKAIQEKVRFQSLLEMFFRDREYKLVGTTEEVFSEDLFKEFKDYEKEFDPKGDMSITKFGRDITNIPSRIKNLELHKLPQRKKNKWVYKITKLGEFE